MPTLLLKYIIVGSSAVGKTCILAMFTEQQFKDAHDMTIGIEFGSREIVLKDNIVKLEIWDTAGQESYLSITRSYYRGTDGCLLVYDMTNRASFEAVTRWLHEARENSNNEHLVVILIANKSDLAESRVVTTEEGEDFAAKEGIKYIELSAKNRDAVEECFIGSASEIYEGMENNPAMRKGSNIIITDKPLKVKAAKPLAGYDCCDG